jgi:hypothetical protein
VGQGMATLTGVKAEIDRLGKLIGASERELPAYALQEARDYVEVDHQGYHLVYTERGEEARFTTYNLDDLLSKAFRHVTSAMALA